MHRVLKIEKSMCRGRGRPQRTSEIFRGGGGTQLQTFADMRAGGVSGMQTSAFLEKVLEGLRSQKMKV